MIGEIGTFWRCRLLGCPFLAPCSCAGYWLDFLFDLFAPDPTMGDGIITPGDGVINGVENEAENQIRQELHETPLLLPLDNEPVSASTRLAIIRMLIHNAENAPTASD